MIQLPNKVMARLRLQVMLLLATLASVFGDSSAYAAAGTPINLLPSACHFTTETRDRFSSMLDHAEAADCSSDAKHSPDVVWLSLDVAAVNPAANTDYELAIYRHWTERAIIQFHYTDGFMQDYDVGAYEFDQFWSVGNYVSFDAPARDVPVSQILIGFQNPSSIKLFHQINFVKADDWQEGRAAGLLLTTVITGVLLAMLFYNIALATMLRFDFHFHYCMVVFAALAYNVSAYGFISYLLPGVISHGTQMNITILALGLNGMASIQFLCSFLEKDVLPPRLGQAARMAAYAFFGFSVIFVNARGPYTEWLELSLHITSFVGVLFVMAILLRAIWHKSQAAIFYAIGWLLPVVGVLARNLREIEVIPHSDFVSYSVSVGIALETVIFAIGVAHRISKIMNERDLAKLESAKAMAASQAKTDFLAHMSHEIRNPMSTIIGLSGLAAQTDLNEQQREYIQNIQTSGNVLMDLLNDTLDMSKIEAGKVTIENIVFAPGDVLHGVRAVIEPRARQKALSLVIEGENTLPETLISDPTRLSQILINLANNAVKFTEQGSVTLSFSTDSGPANTILLKCEVTDTGIGMTAAQVSRLFQSYSQADASVTRKYGGTGLGLSISKQLVELMGGQIGVNSEPGKGSTFFFRLPMQLPDKDAYTEKHQDQQAANPTAPNDDNPLAGASILVVEDNHINQLLISKVLEAVQAKFDLASGGQQAIGMVMANRYDLILMDLNMPDMDGVETTTRIRATTEGRNIPIIAMTGSVDVASRQACLDAGMNDHVSKPFKQSVLLETLGRWRDTASLEQL